MPLTYPNAGENLLNMNPAARTQINAQLLQKKLRRQVEGSGRRQLSTKPSGYSFLGGIGESEESDQRDIRSRERCAEHDALVDRCLLGDPSPMKELGHQYRGENF